LSNSSSNINNEPVIIENILNDEFYENLLYKKKINDSLKFLELDLLKDITITNNIIQVIDNYKIKDDLENIIREKVGNLANDIQEINNNEITFTNRFLQRFKHYNILDINICKWFISEAEKYASTNGGWTSKNFVNHKTMDIKLENINSIFNFFMNVSIIDILKNIQKDYCLPLDTKINILDLNIIKYQTGIQTGLEYHIDQSFLTFNICLNDKNDFTGGGTMFEDGLIMETKQGDMIVHCGKIKHKGLDITSGERDVLVGFIEIIITVSTK
jgi:hypothetical protein